MDKMFFKSQVASNIVKDRVKDLVDGIDASNTSIVAQLNSEILRIQSDLATMLGVAQSTIDTLNATNTEYLWEGTVGGTNPGVPNKWEKIIVLESPQANNVKLKQISFQIKVPFDTATPTATNYVGWIKFNYPHDYVPVNPYSFATFDEPFYKIHPMCENTGWDNVTGDLLAYPQAWGIPECDAQIGTGGGVDEDNFHAPYNFIVNIPIDYKLSVRGLQVWTWVNDAVDIAVSFMYASDNGSISNEA